MTPQVLADTGPLYTAADPSDAYHRRAMDELQLLAATESLVLLPTAVEAYSLILRRLGISAGHRWLRQIVDSATLVLPDYGDMDLAIRMILRFSDQDLSLNDALVFAVSQRLDVPIWTYAHHFDVLRASRWYPAV